MTWNTARAHWPQLLEQLCHDFNHLELTALRRFRGDRTKMETYLAETHDLTLAEAHEALEEWLTYRAPRLEVSKAA